VFDVDDRWYDALSFQGGLPMHRRDFLSKTAAATVGLSAALPERSYGLAAPEREARRRAQRSPNDTINVAVIGIRGASRTSPTSTNGISRQRCRP
jgi:hypothetical protein